MDETNEQQPQAERAADVSDIDQEVGTATPGAEEKGEPPPPHAPRRLERTTDGRFIAGVASGIAEYFNIDASLVRIALVVLSLFGGIGLVLYASGWLLMPERDGTSVSSELLASPRRHGALVLVGIVIVGIVIVSLLSNGPLWGFGHPFRGPRIGWLIALGVLGFLLLRQLAKPRGSRRAFSLARLLRRVALLASSLVALVAVSTLVAVLVTGVSLRGGVGSKQFRPTSLAQLQSTYRLSIGNMTLDLRALPFPNRSVTVDASVAIGRLVVEVPSGVEVSLSARSGIGDVVYGPGGLSSFDQRSTSTAPGRLLILDAQSGIGEVELVRGSAGDPLPASPSTTIIAVPAVPVAP